MAIGRRNAPTQSVYTLTTSDALIEQVGAAPADGSAKWSGALNIVNKTAGAVTVTLNIADNAGATIKNLLTAMSIPANDHYPWNLTIDLMGTQQLRGSASANSAIDVSMFGVEASDE